MKKISVNFMVWTMSIAVSWAAVDVSTLLGGTTNLRGRSLSAIMMNSRGKRMWVEWLERIPGYVGSFGYYWAGDNGYLVLALPALFAVECAVNEERSLVRPLVSEQYHPEKGYAADYGSLSDHFYVEEYFHSTCNNLIFQYLIGIVPWEDGMIELKPLCKNLNHFQAETIRYHNHDLTIRWDASDGNDYHDDGLEVYGLWVDGQLVNCRPDLGLLSGQIGSTPICITPTPTYTFTPTPTQKPCLRGDSNCDGHISPADALCIFRHYLGMPC